MEMHTISFSKQLKIFLTLFVTISVLPNSSAQQTPLTPLANRVFTPFVINPAIAGSKDFIDIDFAAVIQGADKSQILSANSRIAKRGPTYFGAPVSKQFTPFGVGAYFFNDRAGLSRNIGFGATGSYHMPLDEKNLSFLSGGITVKGIYNMMDSIPEVAPSKNSFIPNIDAGVYYYGQNLFAGISVGNLLGNMLDSAENVIYDVPVSRQYFLIAGYKFVVSRSLNIVLEPSLIINLNDSLNFDKKETYNPMLKLYMEDFCVGAYLHDYHNMTFFFQYRFPKLYLGTLVDFPRDVPFYKKDLVIEIAVGLNFGKTSSLSPLNRHW
jgi:type IX secretion system PorP/SprF family membrane protein